MNDGSFLFLAGMDAQVSYAFHSERKLHPEKFKNQLVNQVETHLNCTLLNLYSLLTASANCILYYIIIMKYKIYACFSSLFHILDFENGNPTLIVKFTGLC